MKILFTGDWHLDRMTAGYDRFEDIRDAIEQTVNVAMDSNIDMYVFLGDLANPNNVRSHRAAATAMGVAETLRRAAIDSIWIVGNHDVIEDGNVDFSGGAYSTLSTLQSAGFTVISNPGGYSDLVNGIQFLAFPFPASHKVYDPISTIEEEVRSGALDSNNEKLLAIGHLSLPSAKMGSESADMARGRAIEWPVAAIKEYWPNAIIVGGHYHHQQTCNGVMFPGSLARLGFDEETNEPGYLILEV